MSSTLSAVAHAICLRYLDLDKNIATSSEGYSAAGDGHSDQQCQSTVHGAGAGEGNSA